MAVSLIPGKKPKQTKTFSVIRRALKLHLTRGIVIGAVLLIAALLVYGVGTFLVRRAGNDLEQTRAEKKDLLTLSQAKELGGIKDFARRIKELQKLVDEHPRPSAFFSALEENTHRLVTINDLTLEVTKSELEVEGVTPSFETLGEQFVIWEEAVDFIQHVKLESFTKNSEGQIDFKASIRVRDEFWK